MAHANLLHSDEFAGQEMLITAWAEEGAVEVFVAFRRPVSLWKEPDWARKVAREPPVLPGPVIQVVVLGWQEERLGVQRVSLGLAQTSTP